MPSVDSERPFDCWNNDLNVFSAGGVADGDWPSGGLERVANTGMPAFLIEREEDWNPWTCEPSPNQCADSVCEAVCGRRVDNNRYSVMVPASRHE